jgi:phosphoribosylformylglycinamidine (FGAM) synthase-like enzyme
LVADIPNQSLTDDAPLYHRPVGTWKRPEQIKVSLDPPAEVLEALKQPRDYTADLKKLLASANICSKRWVFEQYDSMVQTNTVQGPGGEAGVMRVKGTKRGLAMALDGNGRWCYLDPKQGAKLAVAEAARKVACTGAVPVAATNCLNFGNPEKPEIMAQLSAAIDGIAEACTALGTPITGGNVSLYNETKGEGIYPTPVIGVVGILEDVSKAVPADFQSVGDEVLLLTRVDQWLTKEDRLRNFGSSEYGRVCSQALWGTPPSNDLWHESQLQRFLKQAADVGLLKSALDVSDGGLAVAIAEATVRSCLGAEITIPPRKDALPIVIELFEEEPGEVIVTCAPEKSQALRDLAEGYGLLTALPLGTVKADRLTIEMDSSSVVDTSVKSLQSAWSNALQSTLSVDTVTA